MPGATEFLTLAFVQDLTVKYNQGENIGLVPEDAKDDLACSFSQAGGYDTVFSDGPIIYGTGMSDADRQKAWKHFFMEDALGSSSPEGVCRIKIFARLPLMPNS